MNMRPAADRWWRGSSLVFAAELLLLPTGLVTAGFLTRQLGAEGYGQFTLMATVVVWVQWVVTSTLARAAQRAIAGADDWRPVAAEVIRLHLQLGLVACTGLMLAAPLVAAALRQPAIAQPLRLFACDLLLSTLANGYRTVLIGTSDHRAWALASAMRWMVRLLAIVLFVGLGWSITGAILGIMTANCAELVVGRIRVGALRRAVTERASAIRGALFTVVAPVAVTAIAMRTFDRADLLVLSAFGADAATLGYYGAAQNLTVIVSLVGTAVSPAVTAAIARARLTARQAAHQSKPQSEPQSGHSSEAQRVGCDALRVSFLLLPFSALAAGSAPEILRTIYGATFVTAAPWFSVLMMSASSALMVSVSAALLVAVDRAWQLVAISVGMLGGLLALAALLMPRLGASGVAAASLVAAAGAAVVAVKQSMRALRIALPVRSLTVALLLAVPTLLMARAYPVVTAGATVAKLGAGTVALALLLLAAGELRPTSAPPSHPR